MNKKNLNQLSVSSLVIILLFVFGCSAPIQLATDLVGNLAAQKLKPSNRSINSNLVVGTQLESYRVGKYEVRMSDGFFKGSPCFVLAAYSNGTMYSAIAYEKDSRDDMEMIKGFKKMNETEKKLFIKGQFWEMDKLDLGPVETAKEEVPANEPLPDLTAPGFAPKPLTR